MYQEFQPGDASSSASSSASASAASAGRASVTNSHIRARNAGNTGEDDEEEKNIPEKRVRHT